MAKITGILPPSAVFIFALRRPSHISRPLAEGKVLGPLASASLPSCHRGRPREREGGRAEDPRAPSQGHPAMVTVWSQRHECL